MPDLARLCCKQNGIVKKARHVPNFQLLFNVTQQIMHVFIVELNERKSAIKREVLSHLKINDLKEKRMTNFFLLSF